MSGGGWHGANLQSTLVRHPLTVPPQGDPLPRGPGGFAGGMALGVSRIRRNGLADESFVYGPTDFAPVRSDVRLRDSELRERVVARSSSGLGRYPLKVEITSSNLVRATIFQMSTLPGIRVAWTRNQNNSASPSERQWAAWTSAFSLCWSRGRGWTSAITAARRSSEQKTFRPNTNSLGSMSTRRCSGI